MTAIPQVRAEVRQTAGPSPLAVKDLDEAMNRYASGDDSVSKFLFGNIAPRVQGFLRRLCNNEELAHDLLQETLLRMHRARGSFTVGSAVVPWAYAIARNCYASHARSWKARLSRRSVDIADTEFSAGPGSCVESGASARQRARIVYDTLAAMPASNREAFILIRYEGQSVADAAQILGTTEGAVKQRAFHAYERLRAALNTE